jgi:hypothetical protein
MPGALQLLIKCLVELGMFADMMPTVEGLQFQGKDLVELSIHRPRTYAQNTSFPEAPRLETLARMSPELKRVHEVGASLLKESRNHGIPDTIPESWLVSLGIDPDWPGYLGVPGRWLEMAQTELDNFRNLATTLHVMQGSLQPPSRIIDPAECLLRRESVFMSLDLLEKLHEKHKEPWLRDQGVSPRCLDRIQRRRPGRTEPPRTQSARYL